MKLRHLALFAASVIGTAMVSSAPAASILVTFNGSAPDGLGSIWSYDANLVGSGPAATEVKTGDKFVIVDPQGLDQAATTIALATLNTAAAAYGGSWAVSYPATTSLATAAFLSDSASLNDVIYTYTGTTVLNDHFLGNFSIVSSLSSTDVGTLYYGANDHLVSPNRQDSNTGTVNGPVAAVPLPAAAWGGMALLGVLGGVQALRRRAMR